MFGPEAGPQALLVHAVCSFGDYTFEAVGSDELAGSDPPIVQGKPSNPRRRQGNQEPPNKALLPRPASFQFL
jgi:hypothetical protein